MCNGVGCTGEVAACIACRPTAPADYEHTGEYRVPNVGEHYLVGVSDTENVAVVCGVVIRRATPAWIVVPSTEDDYDAFNEAADWTEADHAADVGY
jgi:hypothetical protein